MMVTFVAEINGLDFTAIDAALGRARDAMQRARELSLGDLDPTALLGELGPAIGAAAEVQLDAAHLEQLGRQALDALAGLIDLPDLSGVEEVLDGFGELADRLATVAQVFGGGDGDVLDRIFGALSGSLDLDTLLREITDRASKVLGVTIPEEYRRPIESLAALARDPKPGELLDILGSVLTDLDLADVNRLVGSAGQVLKLVTDAGDDAPLEAAIAAVRVRLDAAYTLMEAPEIDVDQLLAAIDAVGAAVDGVAAVVRTFAAGLATDLRTAANALPALDLTAKIDGWLAALPLPGEDIPRTLVESLEGMAEFLEQVDGAAVTAAMAAMKDELIAASGLDRLADLLAGLDEVFDDAGGLLDRLPVRRLRDDAVAALVSAQQAVLSFDGFDFLDAGVAPIRELDAKIRGFDPSAVTDAIDGLVTQLNDLLADVDLGPVRAAVDAVIDPLGEIVDRLVPFVQQVADQLAEVVDELDGIDFEVAGTATLDLMHGIREQVADAVGGGDVPAPVAAAVAAAAAVLRELDLAAELDAPFERAAGSIDIGGLIGPIEEIWRVAGDALRKATPAALIAELDPPFDELLAALDALSLQPLIDALQDVFDGLIVQIGRADPRALVAPLEAAFQDVVRTLAATLDPAPIFAPLRAAYQALRDLLDRIDIEATLQGVLGGLADMPHQLTTRLGTQLQSGVSGAAGPIPAAAGSFELGDILRPLALFLGEVRSRLAAMPGGVLGPVLAELAGATRGLRALTDPETGFAVRLGDALDARLAWLDPNAGDGPLANLRTDLESFRMAVAGLQVSAQASARLTASAAGVQFDARVEVDDAEVAPHAAGLRVASDSADLGRSLRLLARALDAALPTELLTGQLDPVAATDAFLDAVFDRIDPTDLADRLDAVGARIEVRFVALADELASGMFQLVDALFESIEPLMPATVIARLQAGIDRVLARFEALDPAPIEEEVRAVVRAAISLVAVHSPAALAAELGAVFDSCIAQVRAFSPATLFAGADPFAPIRAQLETLRPSVVLADLVPRTAQFTAALDTIGTIDLEFAVGVVADLRAAFEAVLDGVQREWNALLDELSEISVSASVSVG
ncbi:hypothetical protein J7E25_17425 [Agromyces sp. ISL-38]|uniref:hypothetical protein n=1 Tax=Agromyces sp. ISL-38 TaxID=2819107 RepID=UPI001BEA1B4F|nr:hypothetical protein [Agromyces sp. ISL-38]MBT2500878.1 hypothetical protein [Agromyces sp. ISL-38]MBT2518847.1 hypothetical protein [Streptomyces sp. ISL-90]